MLILSSMRGEKVYRAASEKKKMKLQEFFGKQYQSRKFVLKLATVETSKAFVASKNNFKAPLDTILQSFFKKVFFSFFFVLFTFIIQTLEFELICDLFQIKHT